MVSESEITPVILLSKCDLISQNKVEEITGNILGVAPQTTVLAFSNVSGGNINSIKSSLLPGHTYCLIGSSGVGKTTLINRILGRAQFETQSVSKKDGKGRHRQ